RRRCPCHARSTSTATCRRWARPASSRPAASRSPICCPPWSRRRRKAAACWSTATPTSTTTKSATTARSAAGWCAVDEAASYQLLELLQQRVRGITRAAGYMTDLGTHPVLLDDDTLDDDTPGT